MGKLSDEFRRLALKCRCANEIIREITFDAAAEIARKYEADHPLCDKTRERVERAVERVRVECLPMSTFWKALGVEPQEDPNAKRIAELEALCGIRKELIGNLEGRIAKLEAMVDADNERLSEAHKVQTERDEALKRAGELRVSFDVASLQRDDAQKASKHYEAERDNLQALLDEAREELETRRLQVSGERDRAQSAMDERDEARAEVKRLKGDLGEAYRQRDDNWQKCVAFANEVARLKAREVTEEGNIGIIIRAAIAGYWGFGGHADSGCREQAAMEDGLAKFRELMAAKGAEHTDCGPDTGGEFCHWCGKPRGESAASLAREDVEAIADAVAAYLSFVPLGNLMGVFSTENLKPVHEAALAEWERRRGKGFEVGQKCLYSDRRGLVFHVQTEPHTMLWIVGNGQRHCVRVEDVKPLPPEPQEEECEAVTHYTHRGRGDKFCRKCGVKLGAPTRPGVVVIGED